jgi:predicted lipopolysaccharide heptosyltransferase III
LNSLRDIVESSPQLRNLRTLNLEGGNAGGADIPEPLGPSLWNWDQVERVLVVKLRSIGDTVLSTPSLFALKRFLPNASIDILLEDWVAPVLEGHPHIDNVITVTKGSTTSRARLVPRLRANRYDVVYNLHGGSTATMLARASGAKHRVGYATYQYARLHNHIAPSPLTLWSQAKVHSVEQQLGLLGWTGVPVNDRPPTFLTVTNEAADSIADKLVTLGLDQTPFVILHPAAAFATKQWQAQNFARVVDELKRLGFPVLVITTENEANIVSEIRGGTSGEVKALTNLSLPEITALLSRARLFVGNDSGIAHMAAAVNAPSVVIFGSSNRAHWSPWTRNAAEVVFEEMDCQPCHGYYCEKFDEPECIKRVPVERVTATIERVLRASS